jgi:hypothetical protein
MGGGLHESQPDRVRDSGSGARYIAADVELWEHHGEARLQWTGKTYTCNVV